MDVIYIHSLAKGSFFSRNGASARIPYPASGTRGPAIIVFVFPLIFLPDCARLIPMKLRLFPKSAPGCLIAAYCSALAFLAACGWGLPEWVGCVALLYGVANVLLPILRAMQWLSEEKPSKPEGACTFHVDIVIHEHVKKVNHR